LIQPHWSLQSLQLPSGPKSTILSSAPHPGNGYSTQVMDDALTTSAVLPVRITTRRGFDDNTPKSSCKVTGKYARAVIFFQLPTTDVCVGGRRDLRAHHLLICSFLCSCAIPDHLCGFYGSGCTISASTTARINLLIGRIGPTLPFVAVQAAPARPICI
jgi:hypothetical protein